MESEIVIAYPVILECISGQICPRRSYFQNQIDVLSAHVEMRAECFRIYDNKRWCCVIIYIYTFASIPVDNNL